VISARRLRGALRRAPGALALVLLLAPVPILAAEPVDLALTQAVAMAVRNSRALRDARLARDADRLDLYESEGAFRPRLDLGADWTRYEDEVGEPGRSSTRDRDDEAALVAALVVDLPTGASVSYSWEETRSDTQSLEPPGPLTESQGRGGLLVVRQPLLRGGGLGAATAPLRRARIDDRVSELDFRARLMRVVTAAIRGYRALVRADREVEIARLSLEQSRKLLEVNRALIEAGRMAEVDLVQTETEVANAEVDLLTSENDRESAELALVDVLDLPRGTTLRATDAVEVRPVALEIDRLYSTALENRPDFVATELALESARLRLVEARNDRLWNLDLVGTWGDFRDRPTADADDTSTTSWSAGLALGRTFGDRSRKRRLGQASIGVERAEVRLEEARESLRIELVDRLNGIETARRALEVAERARGLSERQLEIAEEKLRVGRATNFEYLRLEGDLVSARLRELAATIAYLDQVTLLDEAVGTTLDTWGIAIPGEDAS